jgi:hypothetical protein
MGDLAGRWRELNKAYWDERVPIHLGAAFYDMEGFRARPDSLKDFETAEVGDVRGKRLIHLQCHFGRDTLSWAVRGAQVTGLDFSPPAIEAASQTRNRTRHRRTLPDRGRLRRGLGSRGGDLRHCLRQLRGTELASRYQPLGVGGR